MTTENNGAFPTIKCPHCGREVPPAKLCPYCGQYLPKRKKAAWKMPKMTPAEIFLAILGTIVLAVALVAL
ncbi:zinc ribbon domain-containing protein [Botryobacter ruber]|uniref:zinc ribbon domain-containing protein n=1 Tax=Botryobacter ruber TaxID=2171629 RepID=UPI000F6537C5|nr:zinc ribbon domain-containing protein [Botryobacter ruber]